MPERLAGLAQPERLAGLAGLVRLAGLEQPERLAGLAGLVGLVGLAQPERLAGLERLVAAGTRGGDDLFGAEVLVHLRLTREVTTDRLRRVLAVSDGVKHLTLVSSAAVYGAWAEPSDAYLGGRAGAAQSRVVVRRSPGRCRTHGPGLA